MGIDRKTSLDSTKDLVNDYAPPIIYAEDKGEYFLEEKADLTSK